MRKPRFDYLKCQRHILLDMHVPDWDAGFLAKFDSERLADLYQSAGAQAVMHYCNSHVGLDNWSSQVGAMHSALVGRDIVGETVVALHARGLASCAYYSSYYHNWAWTHHPDWRVVSPAGGSGPLSKYGVCCPSNQDYHAFQLIQLEELSKGYEFDAFFFDMVFWNDICVCDSCRARFRAEADAEIPTIVDWASPQWCRFAAAREHWLATAFKDLTAAVKRHADIPVFSNITGLDRNWALGVSLETIEGQDLLGGDFGVFGNDIYVASHLNAAMTPKVLQYMNAFTGYIGGASYMIDEDAQYLQHALIALLFGAQFMAIDAVESDGTVNPAFYKRSLAEVFARMAPFADYLGGRPAGEVGVYFSDASRMSMDDSGMETSKVRGWDPPPHMRALRGAVRSLQLKQIPVTVVTRFDLARLADYRVLVLPNAARMSDEEIAAFRAYVEGGGKLYASANTSRLDTAGALRPDFGLADLFGCAFEAVERRAVSYLHPQRPDLAAAIAPRRVAAHGSSRFSMPNASQVARIAPHAGTQVLATLDLPFGHGRGTRENQEWSSIHASPPYVVTDQAVVVRSSYGAGEVIYCAADIEAFLPPVTPTDGATDAGPTLLFAALVESLLGEAPLTFRLRADAGVMAVAFDDPELHRRRLHLANIPACPPARPVPRIDIAMTAPPGRTITGMRELPGGQVLEHRLDENGVAHATVRGLERFTIVALDYE